MIAIGSDHGGYQLKEKIKRYLEEKKIKYKDYGTNSRLNTKADDCPAQVHNTGLQKDNEQ